mgnify:CR=1 FL=1
MVASIKPEYLLDAKDYQRWQIIKQRLQEQENPSGVTVDHSKPKNKRKEAIKFKSLSRRAWTDILAQLVKVNKFFNFFRKHRIELLFLGTTFICSITSASFSDKLCSIQTVSLERNYCFLFLENLSKKSGSLEVDYNGAA